jgi:hypothetical protein
MLPVGRGLLIVVVLACLVFLPARADADIITVVPNADGSFGGTFVNDNDVALIYLSLLGPAFVTFNITSHLALTDPGFDPILTLFTSQGTQFTPPGSGDSYDPLFESFTGSFDSNQEDLGLFFPNVFAAGMMAAGNYLVAISHDLNNFDLATGGFLYDGAAEGQLTNDLKSFGIGTECGASEFVSGFGEPCRTRNFAGSLTIESEDVPQPVPEPGSLTLLALGSAALLAGRGRRSRPRIKTATRK